MGGSEQQTPVLLGRIVGVFGLQGWVKIHSDTQPREAIGQYEKWLLGDSGNWRTIRVERVKVQGKRVIGRLEGCHSANDAEALVGCEIAVEVEQLAKLSQNQYYWRDLIGLAVRLTDGTELGTVRRVFDTGANDVLVIEGKREHLVPWDLTNVIRQVDLQKRSMLVDWDPEF
ncbi:MAG: ribosome maturation factor RimM [Pseudomonadota bacterium]